MKKITFAALAAVMMSMSPVASQADDAHKPAYDKRDNIPTNTFGNCVRTKWDAQGDACAPTPEPAPIPVAVPAPAPAPAPKVSREARTVYFDFNKSTLNADGVAKLNTLIGHIAKSPRIIGAGIAGFADRIGSTKYNLELSKKRAKTVYDYISSRVNINTQILDIRALGENAPVTDCAKSLKRKAEVSCLSRDRRVEVVFQYQE